MSHTQPHAVAEGDADELLARHLSAQGYRVTKPRTAVLHAIGALGDSFTVNEIEQWLVDRRRSPGVASIFRTVKLLTDLGILQRIHGLEDCHRYSLSRGHRHHVICTGCGALVPFDDCEIREMVARLEVRTGYRIERHLLELFGRCPRCQAA